MSNRTLLLSPWYFPIKVLRWEDAVKMRYEGTVDVVVEYDVEICSPSVTWKAPAVVRLRRMPRSRKRAARFSRQACGPGTRRTDRRRWLSRHP